jgi:hypothetical protein
MKAGRLYRFLAVVILLAFVAFAAVYVVNAFAPGSSSTAAGYQDVGAVRSSSVDASSAGTGWQDAGASRLSSAYLITSDILRDAARERASNADLSFIGGWQDTGAARGNALNAAIITTGGWQDVGVARLSYGVVVISDVLRDRDASAAKQVGPSNYVRRDLRNAAEYAGSTSSGGWRDAGAGSR